MAVDRQQQPEDPLGASLGAATEQLRAALEREAVEIINRAREEAASIEEAARGRAEEIERHALASAQASAEEARVRAEEGRRAQSARIAALLEGVDALEDRMWKMIVDMRTQLSSAIDDVDPPSKPIESTAPAAAPPGADEAGPSPLNQLEAAGEPTPELLEMMRAQIVTLVETGKSRAEAENFVAGFGLDESYAGLLDEVYSEREQAEKPSLPSKRRRFGRRRA